MNEAWCLYSIGGIFLWKAKVWDYVYCHLVIGKTHTYAQVDCGCCPGLMP